MKIGRNDPCHCGSKKKYKKCCAKKERLQLQSEELGASPTKDALGSAFGDFLETAKEMMPEGSLPAYAFSKDTDLEEGFDNIFAEQSILSEEVREAEYKLSQSFSQAEGFSEKFSLLHRQVAEKKERKMDGRDWKDWLGQEALFECLYDLFEIQKTKDEERKLVRLLEDVKDFSPSDFEAHEEYYELWMLGFDMQQPLDKSLAEVSKHVKSLKQNLYLLSHYEEELAFFQKHEFALELSKQLFAALHEGPELDRQSQFTLQQSFQLDLLHCIEHYKKNLPLGADLEKSPLKQVLLSEFSDRALMYDPLFKQIDILIGFESPKWEMESLIFDKKMEYEWNEEEYWQEVGNDEEASLCYQQEREPHRENFIQLTLAFIGYLFKEGICSLVYAEIGRKLLSLYLQQRHAHELGSWKKPKKKQAKTGSKKSRRNRSKREEKQPHFLCPDPETLRFFFELLGFEEKLARHSFVDILPHWLIFLEKQSLITEKRHLLSVQELKRLRQEESTLSLQNGEGFKMMSLKSWDFE